MVNNFVIETSFKSLASKLQEIQSMAFITSEVIEKWKETFHYRNHIYIKKSFSEYLSLIPILKLATGYELVNELFSL